MAKRIKTMQIYPIWKDRNKTQLDTESSKFYLIPRGKRTHCHPSTGLVRNTFLCKASSHCYHPRCFMQIFLNPPLEIIAKSCICFWWPKNTYKRHKYTQFSPKHFGQTHVCCFPSNSDIFTSCYITPNSMDTPLLQLTYNIINTPLWKHWILTITSCNNAIRTVLNLFEMQLQRTKTFILRFYKTQSSMDTSLCKPFA